MIKNALFLSAYRVLKAKNVLLKSYRERRDLRSIDFHKHIDFLKSIEKYCMFIGYPRSGHTLIRSCLDAHPNILLASELDALKFIERGYSREQIFHLIIKNSKRSSKKNIRRASYSYIIPNQWQGRFSDLKVIGDKKGGKSSLHLEEKPELLEKTIQTLGPEVRIIHVVRNPFDMITTQAQKGIKITIKLDITRKMLKSAVNETLIRLESVDRLKKIMRDNILDVKLEEFIDEPHKELRRMVEFLDLKAPQDYLDDCASILFKKSRQSRREVEWPPDLINRVNEAINKYKFLKGYTFET